MKLLLAIGLVGVVVCVACAYVASSAMAATTLWLEDGAAIGGSGAGSTTTSSDVILEDTTLGIAVLCEEFRATGNVGPANLDEVSNVTLTKCVPLTGCSAVDLVAAANLPWQTVLTLVGGAFVDELTALGANPPGYLVECVAGGALLDETCTIATSFQKLVSETSPIEAVFDEDEANCTLGGTKAGLVHGRISTRLNNGLILTFAQE